jgi:hypothetical protein
LAGHTLRITRRCLVDDLGFPADDVRVSPHLLAQREGDGAALIRTFVAKRDTVAEDDDERMRGLATRGIPICIIRHGERLRGLTWYDERAGAVWLVAAHLGHRSGERSDSFPYFRNLTGRELLPAAADYEMLRAEEAIRDADAIFDVIPRLMNQAAEERNSECRGYIGPIPISMVMTDDAPPHLHVAISQHWLDSEPQPPPDWLVAVLSRCYRHDFNEADYLPTDSRFPTRSLTDDELGFCDFVSDWPHQVP